MDSSVHVGSKLLAQRQFWRKTGLIGGSIGVALACIFGGWFWYAWIGSRPSVLLSVRWDNISHTGTSRIVDGNQLVFLHGGTLARYNLQTKQKVWSLDLVTQQQIDDALKAEDEENARISRETGRSPFVDIPSKRQKEARIELESELALYSSGHNVWIAKGNTLTHYDWDSGNVDQQITLTNGFNGLTDHGDELLAVGTASDGSQSVTHINMDDGGMRTEEFSGSPAVPVAQNGPAPASAGPAQGGLPLSPYQPSQPMNPTRVAQQAQNMSYAGRLALPALIGNSVHNEQINQEIQSEDQQGQRPYRRARTSQQPSPRQSASRQSGSDESDDSSINAQNFNLVADGDTYIAFGSQLIKENIVKREAMRAPPQHSALDNGNLTAANETAAVNEQLNELQRNNGGDTVVEDDSTYQVVLRRPGSTSPDWSGQVVGEPQFYPLNSVNVLAAGKTITVFDKSNKKLWQGNLTYPVTGGGEPGSVFQSQFGAGPCVENNGTLYVFDQAVLTAYDPTTGNVRWRIPSVGVVGLFFDDKGMVYVNTTSGNPDDIKYSRQIDVTKQTEAIVMKVDPATGNILWRYNPGGYISYLSGKFIYLYRTYDPGDQEDQANDMMASLEGPAYLKIFRISPSTGHVMWEHDEDRASVDVQFDRNTISLVLKKEVEVLKFFSL